MAATLQLVRFDWFIKNMLRDKADFEILEGFLSELLKENVIIFEILESEGNKRSRYDKFNRVDILVKNDKDERIIIEIQNNKEYDYLQRILYGASRAIVENIKQGQSYSVIKKIISISVVYFELGQGVDYIYHGKTIFKGIHKHDELVLSEEQRNLFNKTMPQELYSEYYLIKAADFNENEVKDTLDEWVYFFKKGEVKKNFSAKGMKGAKVKLDIEKLSPKLRKAYDAYVDSLHDEASYNETIKKDTEDYLKEETEKAIKNNSILVAEKAIQKGYPLEDVTEISGLTIEEVMELKRKMN